jgi:ADP-ribose pyrophosphatase YjhB (NUDIX family)
MLAPESPVIEPLIHPQEVEDLTREFGEPLRQTCTLGVTRATYDRWARKVSAGPVACRGEVIMVILRPNGKAFDPQGVYRLLSGRVLWRDDVAHTLHREVTEETSLEVTIESFLGLIEYQFRWQDHVAPFVSYVFELHEVGGELHCLDEGEGIAGFREVSVGELSHVGAELEHLEPQWQDWGNFRAVAHYLVQDALTP